MTTYRFPEQSVSCESRKGPRVEHIHPSKAIDHAPNSGRIEYLVESPPLQLPILSRYSLKFIYSLRHLFKPRRLPSLSLVDQIRSNRCSPCASQRCMLNLESLFCSAWSIIGYILPRFKRLSMVSTNLASRSAYCIQSSLNS